jgi:hypothetical protein
MVSLSLIRKIRFRVGGKHQSLIPVSEALLALKRGNDALVRQSDHTQLSTPGNKKRLPDCLPRPLIDDAGAKNRREAPQKDE